MNPEDLLRRRMELTLACVAYAKGDPIAAPRVLMAAQEYGAIIASQDGEEGNSVPPANPRGTGSAAVPAASESEPLGGAGAFSFPESPSRLIKREDVEPEVARCQNCGAKVKPLYCSARCADEYTSIT